MLQFYYKIIRGPQFGCEGLQFDCKGYNFRNTWLQFVMGYSLTVKKTKTVRKNRIKCYDTVLTIFQFAATG